MHNPEGMYSSLGVSRVPCWFTWRRGEEHHHCNRDRWHDDLHQCICGKTKQQGSRR